MVKYAITTVIFKVPKKSGTPTPHPPTFGTVPQIKSSFSLGAWFIDLKLLERSRISIMKKTTLLVFPLSAGCSSNWWNENIGPGCLVNSEPSTFTFQWELIQVLRDLKQSGDIFWISTKVWCKNTEKDFPTEKDDLHSSVHSLPRKISPQLWRCKWNWILYKALARGWIELAIKVDALLVKHTQPL